MDHPVTNDQQRWSAPRSANKTLQGTQDHEYATLSEKIRPDTKRHERNQQHQTDPRTKEDP